MNEIRKGEIALAVLKYWLSQKGIWLGPEMKRELGEIVQKTGVPREELREFGKLLIEELLEETFSK